VRTTVSTKGQIVIPSELRVEDAISAGDSFEISKVRSGEYLIRRVQESPNKGLTDWLLSCPVKGYFQPVPSEDTDAL
jgi:AbrB family looped-hinge helix DNA binding protein